MKSKQDAQRSCQHDMVLKALVRDISTLKDQVVQMQNLHCEMTGRELHLNQCYEEIKSNIAGMVKQKMESDRHINRLEEQIQDIQMQTRPATVELRNVPLIADESTEDLVLVVLAVSKVIDMEVQRDQLRDLYRLPGTSRTSRPIVAEFVSVMTRNEFLANVRRYNKNRKPAKKINTHTLGLAGEKVPIYIDEHVLPSNKSLVNGVVSAVSNSRNVLSRLSVNAMTTFNSYYILLLNTLRNYFYYARHVAYVL